MFTRITNTPRPYAWGSRTALAELFGREPAERPEAELWFGTHPTSPSQLLDGSGSLADRTTLPFMVKLLAAERPLSLQAHPSLVQAALGFARENAQGIELDAPERNYRDSLHKPELMLALSDRFDALCGFRPIAESRALVQLLRDEDDAPEGQSPLDALLARLTVIRTGFAWLLSGAPEVAEVVARAVAVAPAAIRSADARGDAAASAALNTVLDLAAEYPGDPGVVSSLLLNRVTLRKGEALFLPAGNIHAYLGGLGLELMAASDNVLRGGLTEKHIDVPELLSILEFDELPVPRLPAARLSQHVREFAPEVPDFVLAHVTGQARLPLPGAAIALVTDGEFTLRGAVFEAHLTRGEAVYISPDESPLQITGDGDLFVASTHISETRAHDGR